MSSYLMADAAATGARIGGTIAGALVLWIVARAVIGRLTGRIVRRSEARRARGGETDEAGDEPSAVAGRAATRAETLRSVLNALAGAVIWVMALLVVLGEAGIDLAPLIAGMGIVGVALGFGAQNLVADFLSGMFMLAEDQYGVGDWVDVGDAAGTVEHVGLRTTRIRDLGGLLWTVRNGQIVRTANANQGWGRAVLDVGVAYDADLRRTAAVIKRVADECRSDPDHRATFLDEPEIWGIQELGADSIAVRLVATTQPGAQWGLARELRLRIKEALDAEGIEIPFPQRTVWIRTEPATLAEPIPVAVGDAASSTGEASGR